MELRLKRRGTVRSPNDARLVTLSYYTLSSVYVCLSTPAALVEAQG